MGWEQTRGFSLVVHCWRRAQKAELCMPWVCWMGVSTALHSRESPFHLWDQRFSLCTDQTTAAFSREFSIYVPFLKYLDLHLLPAQEQLWALGGWVLRKGVDFSHMWGELLLCLLPGAGESTENSALSLEQAPWAKAICLEILFFQNSYGTMFSLAVVVDSVLLGISVSLSEQTFLWCYCIQALGSSYFWRRPVYDSKVLCSYHIGGKNAVQFVFQCKG